MKSKLFSKIFMIFIIKLWLIQCGHIFKNKAKIAPESI